MFYRKVGHGQGLEYSSVEEYKINICRTEKKWVNTLDHTHHRVCKAQLRVFIHALEDTSILSFGAPDTQVGPFTAATCIVLVLPSDTFP